MAAKKINPKNTPKSVVARKTRSDQATTPKKDTKKTRATAAPLAKNMAQKTTSQKNTAQKTSPSRATKTDKKSPPPATTQKFSASPKSSARNKPVAKKPAPVQAAAPRKRASTKKASPPKLSIEPSHGQSADQSGHSSTAPRLDDAILLESLAEMVRIRRFEERAGQLYSMGKIGGFCHLYIGQEAVAAGMQLCVKDGDQIVTGYRDHAHMLTSGMEPGRVMAELTGRRDGYSKGKGGSMHMFSVEKHFYGGHGIVGAQVPIGTGLGFANKYRGNGNISFVYFGDGAANQGQVYESFNMAELWRLPVIYVIENNQYAMGTSIERASAQTNLSQRGVSFNIPGEQVNGMDIEEVYAAGQRARDWVSAGKGPIILEMKTYRYRGHSMSDPAKYRKREEVDDVREHSDPIMLVEQKLTSRKISTDDDLKARRKVIYDAIADAVDFALESPLPDTRELMTDILAENHHAD